MLWSPIKTPKAVSGLKFCATGLLLTRRDDRRVDGNIREAISGVLEVMKEQGRRPEANIKILDVAV